MTFDEYYAETYEQLTKQIYTTDDDIHRIDMQNLRDFLGRVKVGSTQQTKIPTVFPTHSLTSYRFSAWKATIFFGHTKSKTIRKTLCYMSTAINGARFRETI